MVRWSVFYPRSLTLQSRLDARKRKGYGKELMNLKHYGSNLEDMVEMMDSSGSNYMVSKIFIHMSD